MSNTISFSPYLPNFHFFLLRGVLILKSLKNFFLFSCDSGGPVMFAKTRAMFLGDKNTFVNFF